MLRALTARIRGPYADREQRVLLAFLQTLDCVHPTIQTIFLAIGQRTARKLFQAQRTEARPRGDEPLDDESAAQVPSLHRDPSPYVACLVGEVLDALADHEGGRDVLLLVTHLETPAEQAARLASSIDVDPGVAPSVDVVRHRQSRVLKRVRAQLAGDDRATPELPSDGETTEIDTSPVMDRQVGWLFSP
jgi:hypothetical protein